MVKNIIKIIKDDFKNLCSSAISLCVVFGLIVVPTIYSLFNIAGYWDPYAGTSQLEIAIVDEDKGYETDILPFNIQLGDYAMAALHENTEFKWVVTDRDTALDKVYSGSFYAALIIPKDFSLQLVDILAGVKDGAKIEYYGNQKFSPITPKLIDTNVSSIQQKINISFSQTVYEAVLKLGHDVTNVVDPTTATKLSVSLVNSFKETKAELDNVNIFMGTLSNMLATIDDAISFCDEVLADSSGSAIEKLYDKLIEAKDKASSSQTHIDAARNILQRLGILHDLDALLRDMSDQCTNIQNTAQTALDIIDGSKNLSMNLEQTFASLKDLSTNLRSQIAFMQSDFSSISNDLQTAIDKISGLSGSSTLEDVKKIIGDDPSTFAELISAPVVMDRHELYPIENFGTAISGFFVSLSCWAGCLILCTMLTTKLSRKRQKELEKSGAYKGWQLYFGRYAIYGAFAFAQSTIMCLGCIFFLQIQMAHPFLFLLTGWIISLCFSFFIYTLVAAFGNAGKVIAVILLVLQVAATGGTFPISMMTEIYRYIYPYLPVTYTVKAFNMCIGGFSNAIIYWQYIGNVFVVMTVISLIIGLLLRIPNQKIAEWFEAKLHATNLFAI